MQFVNHASQTINMAERCVLSYHLRLKFLNIFLCIHAGRTIDERVDEVIGQNSTENHEEVGHGLHCSHVKTL